MHELNKYSKTTSNNIELRLMAHEERQLERAWRALFKYLFK